MSLLCYIGRDIPGYKLAFGSKEDKHAIYVQGTLHAREWIAAPSLLYYMATLLDLYATDTDGIKVSMVLLVDL